MNRSKVYAAIDSERDYQEKVWANMNRPFNNPSSYILWMEEYLDKARKLVSSRDEKAGTEGCHEVMDMVRKVVALGVACGEANGMPLRGEKYEPGLSFLPEEDEKLYYRVGTMGSGFNLDITDFKGMIVMDIDYAKDHSEYNLQAVDRLGVRKYYKSTKKYGGDWVEVKK